MGVPGLAEQAGSPGPAGLLGLHSRVVRAVLWKTALSADVFAVSVASCPRKTIQTMNLILCVFISVEKMIPENSFCP